MRIVTWNCCKGQHAKKLEPLLKLKPDIAIVQEAPDPGSAAEWIKGRADDWDWHGTNKNQGLLVLSFNGWSLSRVTSLDPRRLPEFFLPLRVSKGRSKFYVVAVWAKKGKGPRLYYSGIWKALENCKRLINSEPTVLIGDFNVPCVGHVLQEYNNISAYHTWFQEGVGYETRGTHYFRKRREPYHFDYCFIPEEWRERLRKVDVPRFEKWKQHSDHCPVIVDLAFPGRA